MSEITEDRNVFRVPDIVTEDASDELTATVDAQMMQFAQGLVDAGKRPIFEVWHANSNEHNFDVLELVDGKLVTAPPFGAVE